MFLFRVCNLMMMFIRRSIPLIRFSAGARARQGEMNKIGWRYGLMYADRDATSGRAGTMWGRCVSIRTTCLSRLYNKSCGNQVGLIVLISAVVLFLQVKKYWTTRATQFSAYHVSRRGGVKSNIFSGEMELTLKGKLNERSKMVFELKWCLS
ncbi:hypothetical protein Pan161_03660 [Gimesia algae]|uniref:Uncharacterized protein n=1 Tax=Gimesia algae TaxID=2527971 RepID=A0A517V6W5_9PLAN|nr:hypothetical protein Pan161_03660 [Gimesia algae]